VLAQRGQALPAQVAGPAIDKKMGALGRNEALGRVPKKWPVSSP
jgi:hypothetical protein